jgi:Flp pilus assembly protein TadG
VRTSSVPGVAPPARLHCLHDRSGAVALVFAVSILPVALLIGIAIDLGFVTQSKAQLNAAADAAALAAATTAANAFTAGLPNYIALGQTAGSQWFDSQGKTALNTSTPIATVGVMQTGSVFLSTITYQATVPTYFGGIVGLATIPVGGVSSATISTNAYVSVTFMLDNSSSMLIAATQDGVTLMHQLTPVSASTPGLPPGLTQNSVPDRLGIYPGGSTPTGHCAFACHWDVNNNDYYGLAVNNSIKLRFNVVIDAVATAIAQMKSLQLIANQFSVSIYTFGTPNPNVLTTIYQDRAESPDLDAGLMAAAAIRSPVGPDVANTDFPTAMAQLAKVTPSAGDGSSTASPKRSLIIVTDGVADYGSRQIPSTEGPINPADCNAMKALGYSVYVLYTSYITNPQDWILVNNTALKAYVDGTASPTMVSSLQSCASAPTNFAEASDPVAIDAAMTQLLKAALGNGGRFTK